MGTGADPAITLPNTQTLNGTPLTSGGGTAVTDGVETPVNPSSTSFSQGLATKNSFMIDGSTVATPVTTSQPQIAMDSAGNYVVVWELLNDNIKFTYPNGGEGFVAGEKVRLLPDGRWEWVEPQKAAAQRSERAAEAKRQDDVRQAELRRERGAQGGGQLGFGRTVYEGDRDYNRGSLNPKLR